jgi:hypothetical protein
MLTPFQTGRIRDPRQHLHSSQQRIQDEIDEIWASKKQGEDLTYEDYPKMRTIMALMVRFFSRYSDPIQDIERIGVILTSSQFK